MFPLKIGLEYEKYKQYKIYAQNTVLDVRNICTITQELKIQSLCLAWILGVNDQIHYQNGNDPTNSFT